MIKRFLEWIKLKSTLHHKEHIPPLFKEGEIWWCYFGENIGTEMNGKGDAFTRPVLVLKKYDKFSFLAIRLTTQSKEGTWYVTFTHNRKKQTAILSRAKMINYKRLKELVGKVDSVDFNGIKGAFLELHK